MNGPQLRALLEELPDDVVSAARSEMEADGPLDASTVAALEQLRQRWKQRLRRELQEQGALRTVLYEVSPAGQTGLGEGRGSAWRNDPLRVTYGVLRARDPLERRRAARQSQSPAQGARDGDREGAHDQNSGDVLSEDDEDEEITAVVGATEPDTRNYVLSQYERVLAPSTNKQRVWRVFLRDAMVHVNGQDLLLNGLQCVLDW
ncbi:hypothetical protein CDCA_CDCA19G4746 [Cyanidium caldarium]|uniref:Uncharacterized protein n=1 Tax=Cyanidium caldarium TaxID=2771 RepID=A0AAV9J351_CYACA|nr:hypothetical protein CDCA_CDCA19G4746 [Cyanidium caldarium]